MLLLLSSLKLKKDFHYAPKSASLKAKTKTKKHQVVLVKAREKTRNKSALVTSACQTSSRTTLEPNCAVPVCYSRDTIAATAAAAAGLSKLKSQSRTPSPAPAPVPISVPALRAATQMLLVNESMDL